jgi:hypothetical protein
MEPLGTLRVGEVELPITRLRLIKGGIEVTAERTAPLFGHLEVPAEIIEVIGEDGQPFHFDKPTRMERTRTDRGGTLTVILPINFGPEHDAWITVRRMMEELPPSRPLMLP